MHLEEEDFVFFGEEAETPATSSTSGVGTDTNLVEGMKGSAEGDWEELLLLILIHFLFLKNVRIFCFGFDKLESTDDDLKEKVEKISES